MARKPGPRRHKLSRHLLWVALLQTSLWSGAANADVLPVDNRLFLTVIRNEQPLDILLDARVVLQDDKPIHVWVSAEQARTMGLGQMKWVEDQGYVDLLQVEGLGVDLDTAGQVVRLRLDSQRLDVPTQRLGNTPTPLEPLSPAVRGVVLDYDWSARQQGDYRQVGAWGNVRTLGTHGQWSTSFQGNHFEAPNNPGTVDTVRLDTFWQHYDRQRMLAWTVGDAISGNLEWSRAVRFAGFRMARDFSLQPYRQTTPLLSMVGSAALPGTVDLFIDGVLTSQQEVTPGNFVLDTHVPSVGNGVARMVLTDINGQQQTVDVPFYGSSGLLDVGLVDFGIEAGFLRQHYGLQSWDYASSPMLAGRIRKGVTPRVTLEAHAETMDRAGMAGVGVVTQLPGRAGVARVAVARTQGRASAELVDAWSGTRHNGTLQYGAGWQWNGRNIGLNVSALRRERGFFDVASRAEGVPLPLATDQAWIGFPHKTGQWNVGYVRQLTDLGTAFQEQRYASISWSSQWKRASANATLQHDLEKRETQAYIMLSVPLGVRDRVQATRRFHDKDPGQSTLTYSRSLRGDLPGWGWRMALSQEDGASVTGGAQIDRMGEHTQWSAGFQRFDGTTSTWANGRGAVSWIQDMGIQRTRQSGDSFVLVDTGQPHVPVRLENRPMGTTDAKGRMLVTRLLPWENNRISIDTERLPTDVVLLGPDQKMATPALGQGARVSFDLAARKALSLRMKLHDGAFVPAGTAVMLMDKNDTVLTTSVVGNEGRVWIDATGLAGVAIDVFADHSCRATLPATLPAPDAAGQVLVGELTCIQRTATSRSEP